MAYIDCFNGDADGICALTQLRLAEPLASTLITGVKRDINLLARVEASAGDRVTALDISLDKNRAGLEKILQAGASVFYCDHHFAGDIPRHDALQTLINTTPEVCTSLLINQYLGGEYLEWAVVGTFGDNLKRSAQGMAMPLALSDEKFAVLESLGVYLNYNGYGSDLADLYFHPADLYTRTSRYASPWQFIEDDAETYLTLEHGYHADMQQAGALQAEYSRPHAAMFMLPDEPWARRVSGVFSNDLVNQFPQRAHAVVTQRADGDYLVSLRAPLANRHGADEICRAFPTGGGRAAAAGINQLPASQLGQFVEVFSDFYRS